MTKSQFQLCRKSLLSLLFALICLPVAGWAQSTEQKKDEDGGIQNFAFKDASVKSVLTTMGKQLKINVVYDDTVKEVKMSVELKDMTIKAATRIILVQQHLQARLIEDKTIIVFSDTESNRQRYEQYKVWPDEVEKK